MATTNSPSFKTHSKIKDLSQNFIRYDMKAFMKGKTLVVDHIMQRSDPLKIRCRIVEDDTTYYRTDKTGERYVDDTVSNEGSMITLQLRAMHEPPIRPLLQEKRGTVTFDLDHYRAKVFQSNLLIITPRIVITDENGNYEVYQNVKEGSQSWDNG